MENARCLAQCLIDLGYKMVTDGTDNHLLLWDLRPHGLLGSKFERVCELAVISINKNSVPGDTSALHPGGVRMGTPALTSRGMGIGEMRIIAGFLHRAFEISMAIQTVLCKQLNSRKCPKRVRM